MPKKQVLARQGKQQPVTDRVADASHDAFRVDGFSATLIFGEKE